MEGGSTAIVTDTHQAVRHYQPYQRPSDGAALRTAIPRGLLSFTLQDAATAVKPVNDDMLLNIAFSLPGNFAYVLNEMHMNFLNNRAADWSDNAYLILSNYARNALNLDARYPIAMGLFSLAGTFLDSRGLMLPAGLLPRTPLQTPDSVSAVSGALNATNFQSTASTAGVLNFEVSFFQFDLDQIQFFPANFSQAVTTR